MVLTRSPANPILTRTAIPDRPPLFSDVTSVFNPGAARHDGKIRLMLRVQTRGRETVLLMAESDDGLRFAVAPDPVLFGGLESVAEHVYHVYDPRITRIGSTHYIVFAADVGRGCRVGVARTDDFHDFELMGLGVEEDARNGVLFPEKLGGRYVRLDRPNRLQLAGGATSGDAIRLSTSDDLVSWEAAGPVMRGRPYYWDERIGSGPPPVKTRQGWLHVYHGVATHFASSNIYQAGAVLLDLADPTKVLARSRINFLEPREPYEQIGQVPNVVFPTGLIVDRCDAEGFAEPESDVKLYYGAADTVVALATGTVAGLLAACDD